MSFPQSISSVIVRKLLRFYNRYHEQRHDVAVMSAIKNGFVKSGYRKDTDNISQQMGGRKSTGNHGCVLPPLNCRKSVISYGYIIHGYGERGGGPLFCSGRGTTLQVSAWILRFFAGSLSSVCLSRMATQSEHESMKHSIQTIREALEK